MLPEWLSERPAVGACPCCTVTGPSKKSIVDRTIGAFSGFFDESSYAEGYACKRGLLQFVDPRFKLIGMLWLVVCIILVNRVEWILAILGVAILLAVASKVRLGYYLKTSLALHPTIHIGHCCASYVQLHRSRTTSFRTAK